MKNNDGAATVWVQKTNHAEREGSNKDFKIKQEVCF